MADSEDLRLRRIKEHEERMSRIFDEVMGLGEFADSSRGSGSSTKSGQDEAKEVKKDQQLGEEDSNCSRREEKMDEEVDELFPRIASLSSNPSFTLGASTGSGGAANDNAMDALPSGGVDDDEDWDFTMPSKSNQLKEGKSETQSDTFAGDSREAEEEDNESTTSTFRDYENIRAVLDQSEETDDSQQEPPQTAPSENANPLPSPNVNIKEEPIDEEYDAALLPQNSIKNIKEELEHEEEELRISSVYSVGGSNAFAHPTVAATIPATIPAPVQAPAPTTIFIPGRGTVLQAMAPLPVRPPAPVLSTIPALTAMAPRPPPPTIPGGVRCSGCAKVLLKGQTAFQRKGSTQLFCSTVCLTGHLPLATKTRICFQCNKEILLPREMVTMSAENNTLINFCGQFCLSVFRHKKKLTQNMTEKLPDKRTEKKQDKLPEKIVDKHYCSVCKVTGKIEHEVTHQGSLHRLCSDACFVSWRKMKQLALNCCEGCGLYCNSNSGSCQTLMVDKSELNFCGPTCISTYKQTCRKTAQCACCRKVAVVSSTIMELDQKGKVQLYCSTFCVEKSRPPKHILSDTAFPCSHCKVSAVPQYHLAMVDGTIRNFCSHNCVSTFRQSSHSLSDLTNGTSTSKESPVKDVPKSTPSSESISNSHELSSVNSHHPIHSPVVPPAPRSSETPPASEPGQGSSKTDLPTLRLSCYHCKKQFRSKPQLLSHQGSISMFCSNACCLEYKIRKNIVASCGFCKQEKVLYEKISNNEEDVAFCSEDCKQRFKKQNCLNHSWMPCSYCSSFCNKNLRSHYGGKMEEFCKSYCMSQYTVLYYGMARCDSCRKQGYMTENLQCMGSVRNFCNLSCLLYYCHMHFDTGKDSTSNGSLQPELPKLNGTPAHSNKNTKNHDNASTQTDGLHVPMPRRRPMKNKTILCRPITMDQEISCQLLCPPESSAPLDSQQPSKSSVEASTSTPASPSLQEETQTCAGVPARLSGRHFLGKRDANTDCKVCSHHVVSLKRKSTEEESEQRKRQKLEENVNEENLVHENTEEEADCDVKELNGQTTYYCKTCLGEPSLCPVPCFELYHTRLIYKTVHGLETQGVLPPPSASAEEDNVRFVMVPVPVPVFIPVPMNMYSQHTPVPVAMPLPVPVPMVVPPHKKEMKDAAVQFEDITTRDEALFSDSDENGNCNKTEPLSSRVSPVIHSINEFAERTTTRDPPFTNAGLDNPSSPIMDLETDFPSALDQKVVVQRGVKRKMAERLSDSGADSTVVSPFNKMNHLHGINAWKSWAQQCNKQQPNENPLHIEEDILQCDSYQLSLALCRFIREVRRPSGDTYSPDSIFCLCLGIQKYLFIKGRIENIFTDQLYNQFASEITEMLKQWKPTPSHSGALFSSCVEESFLWECKQLGAYSPVVLLNTLLFFFTKNFGLVTVEEHESLSFANISLCSKPCSRAGRVSFLQFKRRSTTVLEETETMGNRQKEEENIELLENVANPLQCPVRQYEFYLSRCPVMAQKRSDLFYLQPEQNVHTDSSFWYSCEPLDRKTLQSMLTRILAVREVHQQPDKN